ncbi:hypothetical protein CCACVL1_17193 [Corchorus capsularis]|uniref:Uncharacterized protein n=1 Tax=Corchorus capsularis TaxID=210143 RepID=A0A1R3HTU5_COCAP|nr:hypothetical protein CCACVL1_17193 [Corchorus capsularis]
MSSPIDDMDGIISFIGAKKENLGSLVRRSYEG